LYIYNGYIVLVLYELISELLQSSRLHVQTPALRDVLAVGALKHLRSERASIPVAETTEAFGKPTITSTLYAGRKRHPATPPNQLPLIPDILPILPVVPQLPETPRTPIKPLKVVRNIGPKPRLTEEEIAKLWYNQD